MKVFSAFFQHFSAQPAGVAAHVTIFITVPVAVNTAVVNVQPATNVGEPHPRDRIPNSDYAGTGGVDLMREFKSDNHHDHARV
jgi:hypothetical protein